MPKLKPLKVKRLPSANSPEWEEWLNRCRFLTVEDAYTALGLSRGAWYRAIKRAPTLTERLAMRAVLNQYPPF